MKKSSKTIMIVAVIFLIIAVISFVLINNKNEKNKDQSNKDKSVDKVTAQKQDETETNDFMIMGVMTLNKKVTYTCFTDDYEEIDVNASSFDLPGNLYDFSDEIELRLTYSKNDYKVSDCKVINKSTGKVIDDISEDHLNKLFNIEYGKTIQEVEYLDEIYLSALTENEIYKFQNDGSEQLPTIVNNLEKNCIVYTKKSEDSKYEKEIYTGKAIKGDSFSFSSNEGECLYIMYKKAGNGELLKMIEADDIIYIDDSTQNGEELSYTFEDYIYNNTDNEVKLLIKNDAFGMETENEYVIEPEEICSFDWMIDSVIVEF